MSADHADHAADLDKHVRAALIVFGTLMLLTFVTVGVAELDLPTHQAIAVALFIAIVKGTLVACYFMHLISERKLIFGVLGVTFAFFFVLLLVPLSTSVLDHVGHLIIVPHAKVAEPAAEHGHAE
jgi:cytochrome c oxidase subunit 4